KMNIFLPIGLFMCGGLYLSCVTCIQEMREIYIIKELSKKWKKLWRIGKADRRGMKNQQKSQSRFSCWMERFTEVTGEPLFLFSDNS
ncbi:MAG: hypothetical protein K2I96_25770, partial [Lachnospiraceae bacterium]|nr:hypothetical protein [Lachnospiraceae bacterium]